MVPANDATPPLGISRNGKVIELDVPIMAAPMAGAIDPPYRSLLHRYGCVLSFTEMVNARGLCDGSARSLSYIESPPAVGYSGAQLFGSEGRYFSKAAAFLETRGFDIIDLNAGCPKRKVLSNGAGGALLKDPARLVALLSSILDHVKVPVGAKLRSGYDHFDGTGFKALLKDIEGAGASYVTIHPRTVSQGFRGTADREVIALASGTVDIPVIASGDVKGPVDVLDYLKRWASGVMVGRVLLGDPTWFVRCRAALENGPDIRFPSSPDDIISLMDIAREHMEISISFHGGEKGVRYLRPHLSWYLARFRGRSLFRDTLFSLSTREEVLTFLDEVQEAWTCELPER